MLSPVAIISKAFFVLLRLLARLIPGVVQASPILIPGVLKVA
jgi:hypothetical protein